MVPRRISPRSVPSRLEIALSVVVLPAPLAPEKRDDRAFRDLERHAAKRQDRLVIDRFDVAHLKERGRTGLMAISRFDAVERISPKPCTRAA